MPAALLLAAACSDDTYPIVEADYAQVREACAAEVEAWSPVRTAAEVVADMSSECAAKLGVSVGMDWEGFDFTARDLERSPTGAYVLAGLLTVVASDEAELDTVVGDPELPFLAAVELERIRGEEGGDGSMPASEAWFVFLRESLWDVRSADTIPGTATAAYYDVSDHTVYVTALILDWDKDLAHAPLPAYAASVLLHESWHRITGEHQPCPSNPEELGCDPTPEGPYGAQVWWLDDWQRQYPALLEDPQCIELDNLKRGACIMRIEDTEGWTPCNRACPE